MQFNFSNIAVNEQRDKERQPLLRKVVKVVFKLEATEKSPMFLSQYWKIDNWIAQSEPNLFSLTVDRQIDVCDIFGGNCYFSYCTAHYRHDQYWQTAYIKFLVAQNCIKKWSRNIHGVSIKSTFNDF